MNIDIGDSRTSGLQSEFTCTEEARAGFDKKKTGQVEFFNAERDMVGKNGMVLTNGLCDCKGWLGA